MSGSRRKPGPLGPFVEGYRAWLLERGYSTPAVIRSLGTLGHVGRWMERDALAVNQLSDEKVNAFLMEYRRDRSHLPSASVWPLLEYLRAQGAVAPDPPRMVSPVEQLVDEYRDWLVGERGLASSTVRGSAGLARRFLTERVVPGRPTRGAPDHRGRGQRVSAARVRAGEHRDGRVLHLLAAVAVALPRGPAGSRTPVWSEAVPRVARWRDATIPQFPARLDIDRLLAACDRNAPTGARDYAVLLLLARLGLRAVEVSRLRLDDLDWRAGTITVDGKGSSPRSAAAAQRRRRGARGPSQASRPPAGGASRCS